jgi:homoaconitase/3-isopropylmalate dehydratase large subunit
MAHLRLQQAVITDSRQWRDKETKELRAQYITLTSQDGTAEFQVSNDYDLDSLAPVRLLPLNIEAEVSMSQRNNKTTFKIEQMNIQLDTAFIANATKNLNGK